MMANASDVGISPVLLQAIAQTITSQASLSNKSQTANSTATEQQIVFVNAEDAPDSEVKAQSLLYGLNQPTNTINVDTEEELDVNESTHQFVVLEDIEGKEETVETFEVENIEAATPVEVANVANESSQEVQPQDIQMGNVLSAIASDIRAKREKEADLPIPQTVEIENANEAMYVAVQGSDGSINPMLTSATLQDIAVSNGAGDISESTKPPSPKKARTDEATGSQIIYISQPSNVGAEAPSVDDLSKIIKFARGGNIQIVSPSGSSINLFDKGPCPICSDRSSGYHYGIYSCESCKGFFKRTVQNKKSFLCHRNGDCDINMLSRKKCPACRFKKCLLMGMKIEAIREDRQRGGRSSYEGCTPTKPPPMSAYISTTNNSVPGTPNAVQVDISQLAQSAISSNNISVEQHVTVQSNTTAGPNIIVEGSGEATGAITLLPVPNPVVPDIIYNIMTVETCLNAEDPDPELQGRWTHEDGDLLSGLLTLADVAMYKIVRWARNLPDFMLTSTEDQIMLLQNCWAELLCLTLCWQSKELRTRTIRLCNGKQLDMALARGINFEEVLSRMLGIMEHIRRLKIDQHEFVCLKVLLLMSPDVKGLKDQAVVRDYQEKITDALITYTATHSPQTPNKFGQMLLRLSEISKLCAIGKQRLAAHEIVNDAPASSLLMELLKGDNLLKQDQVNPDQPVERTPVLHE
ncbi:unnamed protein product [Owenia fusiformis]|uniref:Uncharacterized protein n=1 Tax=Owenia fusiformis TaxID=6347 RepID=A0A8J1XVJ0_OWEFU|nr:unnamed protein product [Owenia fusiformis]